LRWRGHSRALIHNQPFQRITEGFNGHIQHKAQQAGRSLEYQAEALLPEYTGLPGWLSNSGWQRPGVIHLPGALEAIERIMGV